MQNLLASVGVAWEPARHSSEHTASKGGANVRKEAYEDLLAALRASPHAKLAASIATEDSLYDDDHGNWVTRSIRLRRGQPKFRAALLEAYAGRCAVTGSETVSVLEAAHIRPFADGGAAVVQNGLLLRADVHTLFDLGRIGITEDYFVVMHPSLSSSEYSRFAGQLAHVPASRPQRPDGALLEQHVSKWALGS
ncbi:hypothetical protein ASF05_03155 [Aeromicrobium sp. Leaf245]|nr:hypothetical protein ASF05_03155 [Aeromicrobium sp. Leaf245]